MQGEGRKNLAKKGGQGSKNVNRLFFKRISFSARKGMEDVGGVKAWLSLTKDTHGKNSDQR